MRRAREEAVSKTSNGMGGRAGHVSGEREAGWKNEKDTGGGQVIVTRPRTISTERGRTGEEFGRPARK